MRNLIRTASSLAAVIAFVGLVLPAFAGQLSGYGQLSGKVTGSTPGVLPTVVARHIEKEVSFVVFVVNGEYTAVNLIPGNFDVTIRPAVDQPQNPGAYAEWAAANNVKSGEKTVEETKELLPKY